MPPVLKDTIAYYIFFLHFSKECFPWHRSSMSCKLVKLSVKLRATLDFNFQKNIYVITNITREFFLGLFKFSPIFNITWSHFLVFSNAVQHRVSRRCNNSHITKWQPFKANVPCVTIDGSRQMTSFKSASRINGFLFLQMIRILLC